MLPCVAVCCRVLQCVAVCCSVLQLLATRGVSASHTISGHDAFVFAMTHLCGRVLQCVAVCCSVLQGVAVCCRVLQCAAVCCSVWPLVLHEECLRVMPIQVMTHLCAP